MQNVQFDTTDNKNAKFQTLNEPPEKLTLHMHTASDVVAITNIWATTESRTP